MTTLNITINGQQVSGDIEEHRTGDMSGGEQPLGLRGAERGRPPHVGDHDLLAVTREPRCVDQEFGHVRVTMTGAWSLGFPSPNVGLRSSRSTTTSCRRFAIGWVPSARSIRSPHPLWNAPAW